MNVDWQSSHRHPVTKEFLGCLTTDSPEEFKLWLVMNCDSHRIGTCYERVDGAVILDGGYPWRINVYIPDPKDAMLFKLTWQGSR